MKEAMGEVAEELQVRELIRYLNKGLNRKNDRFEDSEFLPTSVASFDIWRAPSWIPRSSGGRWIGRTSI